MKSKVLLALAISTSSAALYAQSGNVGIGTTTPTAKLHVAGTVRIVDGSQGASKVLTSDANGLASWQTPAAGVAGDYDWMKSGNAFPNSPGDTAVNIYHIGGSVGVGTNAPVAKLHVYSSSASPGGSCRLENDLPIASTNDLDFFRSNSGGNLAGGNSVGRIRFVGKNSGGAYQVMSTIESQYTGTNGNLIFSTPAEAMRITETNKVGIGTPTPSGKLTVSGNGGGVTPILTLTNTNVAGNPTLNIYPGYTSSVGAISEGNQYAVVFDQDPGQGNVGAVQSLYDFHGQIRYASSSTLSDRRLKENITDMNQYGLKEVMKMQPRNYTMKEYQTKDIGFIAQELKQIVPELVMGKETENTLLSVDYSKVCLVLINAIKDQQAQIEVLKTANTGLKASNTELKAEVSKIAQLSNELNALKASVEKFVPKPELASNQ
jgi:hypothetical protein